VDAAAKHVDIIRDLGTTDARVADDVEVVTDGAHNLVRLVGELAGWGEDERLALLGAEIDPLEDANGESGSLTGTGLGLRARRKRKQKRGVNASVAIFFSGLKNAAEA